MFCAHYFRQKCVHSTYYIKVPKYKYVHCTLYFKFSEEVCVPIISGLCVLNYFYFYFIYYYIFFLYTGESIIHTP